jgi:hypothetical protein
MKIKEYNLTPQKIFSQERPLMRQIIKGFFGKLAVFPILLNAAAFIGILLMLTLPAPAVSLYLPEPPAIPPQLSPEVRKPLEARYNNLVEEKKRQVAELNSFNEKLPTPVPADQAQYYQDWLARMQRQAQSYEQKVARLQMDLQQKMLATQLKSLQQELAQTQEQLQRLNKSILSDSKQFEEWEATIQQAVTHAQKIAPEALLDMLMIPSNRQIRALTDTDKQMGKEIQELEHMLSQTKDPNFKATFSVELLQKAIKRKKEERGNLGELQSFMIAMLKTPNMFWQLSRADVPEYQKAGKALEQLLLLAGDEAFQQHLQRTYGIKIPVMSKLTAIWSPYRHGKRVVEVAYDITAVSLGWTRLRQLDRNSQEYLNAVSKLKERTVKLVQAIEQTKKEMK